MTARIAGLLRWAADWLEDRTGRPRPLSERQTARIVAALEKHKRKGGGTGA